VRENEFYYLSLKEKEEIQPIHILLFILTFLTTTFFGAMMEGGDPLTFSGLKKGFPYSLSLMGVLFVHEMGHFLTSRYYGVRVTFPYFIPAPNLVGTFGAFIKMKSPIPNKRILFDIGFAGPFAGFIASIIALYFGIKTSKVVISTGVQGGISLGTNLAMEIIIKIVKGRIPEGHDILLGPVAFAGWLGLLVTAMNLIPVGQTDGGHIFYSVAGRAHYPLAFLFVIGLIILGSYVWPGWLFWALILVLIGMRHPPVINPFIPLDRRRRFLFLVALAIFLLSFSPEPFKF
jgi:membrane-associated protease RseP (regulator of RpoE activity)